MKVLLVVLLVATSAFAQSRAAIVKAACGPKNVNFDVTLDKTQHKLSQPGPGKALVYFVQDIGTPFGEGVAQKTVVGIDGQWVGENQNESWFSVQIEPGMHHFCVSARAHFGGQVVELVHIEAEAGHTYYFRTRDFMWQTHRLEFGPVDSDQAKYMIASYPMAISSAKK